MDLFGIACNILYYEISGIGEILKLFGMTFSWWYRLRTLRHNEVKSFLKEHYYFRKCILLQHWRNNLSSSEIGMYYVCYFRKDFIPLWFLGVTVYSAVEAGRVARTALACVLWIDKLCRRIQLVATVYSRVSIYDTKIKMWSYKISFACSLYQKNQTSWFKWHYFIWDTSSRVLQTCKAGC